ncbi:hypothetical protein CVT25_002994, partial [Psilocybe cyanescens]
HSKDNPPVDLGYAPNTGATHLKPKLYWRYLGFYFDRKLTFTEHVRYYSTKALSTVKAMNMLGSSTRGLRPVQKRVLYRACVLPIVTYGFRLWYFAAARCKGALHHLSVMQRSAALWITGAFRTSPTGGVEALAGLPPINLLLRPARCKGALHHLSTMQRSAALWITGAFRTSPTGGVEALVGLPSINLLLCCLSERADYRFATLTPTHPVRAFLSCFNCSTIAPHPSLSIQTMSEPEIFRTSGTLFESDTNVLALTETLLPMNPLSRPGVRLMDRFADQVHFNDCKISRGDADKELKQRTKHLNKLRDKISENIGTYYAGTDASLPLSGRYQAIAASILFSGGGQTLVCPSQDGIKPLQPPSCLAAESSAGVPDMSQAKSPPQMRSYMPSVLQSSMRLRVTTALTFSSSRTRWLPPVELSILPSTPDRATLWLS